MLEIIFNNFLHKFNFNNHNSKYPMSFVKCLNDLKVCKKREMKKKTMIVEMVEDKGVVETVMEVEVGVDETVTEVVAEGGGNNMEISVFRIKEYLISACFHFCISNAF